MIGGRSGKSNYASNRQTPDVDTPFTRAWLAFGEKKKRKRNEERLQQRGYKYWQDSAGHTGRHLPSGFHNTHTHQQTILNKFSRTIYTEYSIESTKNNFPSSKSQRSVRQLFQVVRVNVSSDVIFFAKNREFHFIKEKKRQQSSFFSLRTHAVNAISRVCSFVDIRVRHKVRDSGTHT